jgi:hypothetical protein
MPVAGDWACGMCTFINTKSRKCEACGFLKELQVSKDDRTGFRETSFRDQEQSVKVEAGDGGGAGGGRVSRVNELVGKVIRATHNVQPNVWSAGGLVTKFRCVEGSSRNHAFVRAAH